MGPKRVSLSLSTLTVALVVTFAGVIAASVGTGATALASTVSSSSLGTSSPTFTGAAATGCSGTGCSLLTGPYSTPQLSPSASSHSAATNSPAKSASLPSTPRALPDPARARSAVDPTPPAVTCSTTIGPGCDSISASAGGAAGVKGLDAVDSATLSTNTTLGDIEPADQGLCAGNGYVVESNNIGEVLIFNTALQRMSQPISDDTLLGLASHGSAGWSSGGDPSCLYDSSNGGHWIFTEIVSTNSYASGGPFTGCFAAAANACLEGIAVTTGSSPFGPYNAYFLNANYNPQEPGYPYLLNDFAKISMSRDAFLIFYDEFPLRGGGLGGGGFNGAQELAFSKDAMEAGDSVTLPNGKPNPVFNVAIENMGLFPVPPADGGSCTATHGVACWYQVIPAQPPDPSQYDNANGGSAFMLGSLDFFGNADTRIAAFDWTGLKALHSGHCNACSSIQFGGQLFSGVEDYYGEGFIAAQKAGPIPLGDECVAAGAKYGYAVDNNTPTSCPENGIATNGDGMTQVAQAQGQIWGAVSTEVDQSFSGETSPEVHQAVAYWVIGTNSFDQSGTFSLTSQGYVSAAHEDIEFPAIAAEGSASQDGGNGGAIMTFTLSGNGGPTGADGGGFFPSTAYGRLTSTSGGLVNSTINIADLGQSPEDGFTEYQQPLRPRWGDYSWAVYAPGSGGKIYFATNYIQYPNCTGSAFTLTFATCGGTRDGQANWGTSVNSVVP